MELTPATNHKIQNHMKIAQRRQKSYADIWRWPLEFGVGDHVFLKVAPIKGAMRFGRKRKLSPRYINPFKIIDMVGEDAYCLALPPDIAAVHNVFHVSMLRKYVGDLSLVLCYEVPEIEPKATYEEKPMQILDWKDKELRNMTSPMVKVL